MEQSLVEILSPAYKPCRGFADTCHEMKWHPAKGHIPRGFLGATGALGNVELVLVFAEPGDPQPDEKHSAGIESALKAANFYHSNKQDQFHKNSRYILDLCWPNLPFEKQLEKVWMTESVLCSAPIESGRVRSAVERACGERYLLRQLALFPDAVVVALGAKAQKRMRALGYDRFIAASAVAAPEGNPRLWKYYWRVFSAECPWEDDDFFQLAPVLGNAAFEEEVGRILGLGQNCMVYSFRRPRADPANPWDRTSPRWQDVEFAVSYDEDSDQIVWGNHK